MNEKSKTLKITILALMTALIMLFSFTPLGSVPIGPLVITLNVIPVAISAIVLGPAGGATVGGIFGFLSFLQCFGIGVPSGMGEILVGINPLLAFLQRFLPRVLEGLLAGFVYKAFRKKSPYVASAVTGFSTAFFNTVFFMSALVLFFGNTEYVQGLIGGRNIIVFVCMFVGINAVVEMITATLAVGAVGAALVKAKVIR